MAGFGTAGSMLAGAAILFVMASAIVAFRGWPRIATQTSPAAVQIDAAPAAPSRVGQRLREAAGPDPAPAARPPARAARTVSVARPAVPNPLPVSSVATPSHRLPTVASGPAAGAGARPSSVSNSTNPPGVVTIPSGRLPEPVRSVVRKVATPAGGAVSSTGAQAGGAVGGPVGSAVTKVGTSAGTTISNLGSGALG